LSTEDAVRSACDNSYVCCRCPKM